MQYFLLSFCVPCCLHFQSNWGHMRPCIVNTIWMIFNTETARLKLCHTIARIQVDYGNWEYCLFLDGTETVILPPKIIHSELP